MPKSKVNPPLFILLVFIFCFNLLPIPVQAQNYLPAARPTGSPDPVGLPTTQATLLAGLNYAPGYNKVVIDNSDKAALASAAKNGGFRLADYDSFSLWKIPATPSLNSLTKTAAVEAHPEFDQLELRSGKVSTVQPPVKEARVSGSQLWLVQFVGPIKPEWLETLTKLGITPVIYMPNNAYVVWADGSQIDQVNSQVAVGTTEFQWAGNYKPEYRMAPALQNLKTAADKPVAVTVQFYTTPSTQDSIKRLTGLGGKVIEGPSQVLNFTDITLEVPASAVAGISAWADVFNIEPWVAPKLRDERQGQIVAGNVTTSGTNTVVPSAPGYLNWLTANGFSSNPSDYPLVDITDDGIDNGTSTPLHPDFYQFGSKSNPDRLIYNQNCTADSLPDGQAGHGNLNAGIVGGYNNSSGSPYEDAQGYQYGLGISPFGRIGGTKIFNNTGNFDLSACANTVRGVVAASFNAGAKITSNSWGADNAGAYDADAQAYDALTRDASSTTSGNQQMLHIFAAGNTGSGAGTVGSPGTAKNVLTVGATENVRDDGILDGCAYAAANSADDMATFSSRGPTTDSRSKPDIVAPGTHVQGPASQDPTYDGTGVCGGANNGSNSNARYYPNFAQNGITQTLYTWSSGTSHSTPALAGAASLVYNYYQRVLDPGKTPTPAMLKGLLINGSRYLNGSETGDTLPSNNQGWGGVDLNNIFNSSNHYCQLINQSVVLTGTGQFYSTACQVADTTKPVRITLAWTDAPGSTTGSSYVNNLDLQVSFNGNTYKGNVFNGAFSTTGGSFDTRNNVENVFLPAGTTGLMGIKVTAANLAADAINGGPGVQQDFALIISNADPGPAGGTAILAASGTTINDLPPGGNANGLIEPGETIKLSAQIANNGTAAASGVTATLTTNNPYITIINGTATYSTIPANSTAGPDSPFSFSVDPALPCGQTITLTLQIYYGGTTLSSVLSYVAGTPSLGSPTTYTSTDVPKAIPDNNPTGITSTLAIATGGTVGKVTVTVNVTHTYDGDITLKLISPQGTTVTLVARRGGGGDNFTGTVFDDAAATSISNGSAPFAGTFRPETPLSAVNDQPISGTWQLLAIDSAGQDIGSVTGWSLTISPRVYTCSSPTPQPAASFQVSGYPSPVTVGSSNPFTVTAKDSNGNLAAGYTGTVNFSTNAPSATLPASYTFQPGDYGQHVFTASFNATGTYSITATDSVSPGITGAQSGIAVQGAPAVISATGGNSQSAGLNQQFPSHLTAVVKDNANTPLGGVVVTFTAPGSGASAIFSNGSNVISTTTNASGIADSGVVYANGVAGSYTATATVAGVATPATYSLTNVATTCNAYVVTVASDDGQGLDCGTLTYAINSANAFFKINSTSIIVITFNLPDAKTTLSVTGKLPSIKAGITLDGGSCSNGPAITIDGSGYAGDGLTLAGGNLYNLRVANFGGKQIVAGSGGGELRCVRAVKSYSP